MKEPMWGVDPFEDEQDPGVPTRVVVTGVLAFAPIWSLVLAFPLMCTGVELLGKLGVAMIAVSVLSRLAMGLLFTIDVWRSHHKSGGEQLLWTIGLLFFFPIFNIPYYWHREIWQAFQAERFARI